MFNGADYLILAVVALSALFGVWRGFVKEVFSLLNWVLAFALSYLFYRELGSLLPIGDATSLWIRDTIAAVLIFVCTLIAGSLLVSAMNGLVKVTGLTGTDRILGLLFGFARAGMIILVLLLFLPTVTPIADQSWWVNSKLIPMFLEFEDRAFELHENFMIFLQNTFGRSS